MQMAKVIVIKEDKTMEAFDREILTSSLEESFHVSGTSFSSSLLSMLTDEVITKLITIGTELYGEDIFHAALDTLEENGYDDVAMIYRLRNRKEI